MTVPTDPSPQGRRASLRNRGWQRFAKNLPQDAHFGFLPKPFSLKKLATVVKEVLEDSRGLGYM
jgi:hypothetical protein